LSKSLSSSAIPTSQSIWSLGSLGPRVFAFVVGLALAFEGLGAGVSHAAESCNWKSGHFNR
jgi:hypothetical protein